MKKFFTILSIYIFSACFSVCIISAQTEEKKADDWKFSGQIMLRTELDGRDFNNKTYPYGFTISRVRFGAEKKIFKDITGFLQIQDSRLWGEEKATIGSIKNLDLHQGYVMFNNIFNESIYAQAGRFKMKYGSERWISANEFHYVARAFDGIRLGYKSSEISFDLFSAVQNPSFPYVNKSVSTQYPTNAIADTSFSILGLWASANINTENSIEVLVFNEHDNKKTIDFTNDNLNRYTAGLSYNLKMKSFNLLAEFAYQFGTIVEGTDSSKKDIGAYNFGLEANLIFEPISVGILVDLFSGTKADEKEKYNTFTRSLGGNHKFHGIMDYFADMKNGTNGRGVNDFALIFGYKEKDNPFSFQADFHYFLTNVDYTLVYGENAGENKTTLGEEIDLRFRYQIVKTAQLELGACAFLPGDVIKDRYYIKPTITNPSGTLREDPSFWMYLQLKVDL